MIASASGASIATFADSSFWAMTVTAVAIIHGSSSGPVRPASPSARCSSRRSRSRTRALAATPAEVALERRHLIDTGCDDNHAGGERAVRAVQHIDRDAHEHPDRQIGPNEQRHLSETTARIPLICLTATTQHAAASPVAVSAAAVTAAGALVMPPAREAREKRWCEGMAA
jgi:hypothetical protein